MVLLRSRLGITDKEVYEVLLGGQVCKEVGVVLVGYTIFRVEIPQLLIAHSRLRETHVVVTMFLFIVLFMLCL